MKKILSLVLVMATLASCGKEGDGIPEAQGGLLPTNYIYIKENSFSPADAVAVSGSSFTFVNQSASAKGIYSVDSLVINKQSITENTSYFFKKDTIGTIYYFMAGKPAVRGSLTLTR